MKLINENENKFLSNLIVEKLSEFFKEQITVDNQDQITDEIFEEFRTIENYAFPESLRYTKNELIERFSNPFSIFLIIKEKDNILAVILGYEYDKDSDFFFLDTIIVTLQKKGIGRILLECLSSWVKFRSLKGIVLFTEEFNDKGENLINFYHKNGFQKINELNGNITMTKIVN